MVKLRDVAARKARQRREVVEPPLERMKLSGNGLQSWVPRRRYKMPTRPLVIVDGPGRPSLFTYAEVRLIEAAFTKFHGVPSNVRLAQLCGVTLSTFNRWLAQYEGLREWIDQMRAVSLGEWHKMAHKLAMEGDGAMIRWWLERRDEDFMPKSRLDVADVTPNWSNELARPEFV